MSDVSMGNNVPVPFVSLLKDSMWCYGKVGLDYSHGDHGQLTTLPQLQNEDSVSRPGVM